MYRKISLTSRITMFISVIVFAGVLGLAVSPAGAWETQLGGKPFSVQGYINQTVSYGTVSGDWIDTQKGFNSFVTQGLIEGLYQPDPSLALFASLKFNGDWAYPVYAGRNGWRERQFDESRDRLFILDKPRDFIQEAHVTWQQKGFYIRAGKQVVGWGETDGFRLMDQINPVDGRRGLGDVEFENTIIPIWLIRTEYRTPVQSTWLQDLTFQFVFNPNADKKEKIFNQIWPGNNVMGIWGPYVEVPFGGPYPFDYGYLGSMDENISSPKTFDPQGYAYALRISGTINDARISLNGYYGRDHNPALRIIGPPRLERSAFDGRMLVHLPTETYFPFFRFVGATFTKDLSWLTSAALGGVAPVLRVEALYAFDSTFTNHLQQFVQHDEMRAAVGVDWKVRINALNSKSYFYISPQVYNRRVMDYPSVRNGLSDWNDTVKESTWVTTLYVNTTYFHNKLQPSFFWMRDWTFHGSMYIPKISWEHSNAWKYSLGWIIMAGEDKGHSLQRLSHKDQLFATVSYKFD